MSIEERARELAQTWPLPTDEQARTLALIFTPPERTDTRKSA